MWLKRFCKRWGLKHTTTNGESGSADTVSSEYFKAEFMTYFLANGYERENVYNGDETGLFWKATPKTTYQLRHEKRVKGLRAIKDRVTLMTGGNATGSHRIPLLVIGKSLKPRAFKNKSLPTNIVIKREVGWTSKSCWTGMTTYSYQP